MIPASEVVVRKKSESRHQRAVDTVLRVLSLGRMTTYLSDYVTTLGHTIYVPDGFDAWPPLRRDQVMRHELVHVRQYERYGWIGMIVIYGLFPLPIGLAYGRARLEWEAYEETLRAVAETEGLNAARDPRLHAEIIRRFTGPDYLWMWPFPRTIQRWIDDTLRTLSAG